MRFSFYISIIVATGSCLFGFAQETDSLYFKGSINQVPMHFKMSVKDSAHRPFTGVRYNDAGPSGNIFIINECGVLDVKGGRTRIGIGFYNRYPQQAPPTVQESQAFLRLGKYPFSIQKESIVSATPGVMAYYLDERNYEWVSQTGPQGSSTFEITEIATFEEDGKINTVVSVRFSCLVYNMYNENFKLEGIMRNILFSTPNKKN
jgi:hypothetical protein